MLFGVGVNFGFVVDLEVLVVVVLVVVEQVIVFVVVVIVHWQASFSVCCV